MSTRTCPDVSSLTRYLTSTLILSILIPVKRSDQSELCVCVCVFEGQSFPICQKPQECRSRMASILV
jgi:hypothetical protein